MCKAAKGQTLDSHRESMDSHLTFVPGDGGFIPELGDVFHKFRVR